jgi:hypothetical protein
VIGNVQRYTVTTNERTIEGTVEDVGAERLFRFDHRLGEMLRIDPTDTNVVAVFDQDFGKRERQTEDLVDVTLNEQHSACVECHRSAVRHFWCSIESEEDRLFMVRTGGTLSIRENTFPFIGALVVNSVKSLVKDRLND